MNKLLLVIGAVIFSVGLLLTYAPNALHWFGRLPGDIRIENEQGGFYFPVVSMLLISIVLSIIARFLGRH